MDKLGIGLAIFITIEHAFAIWSCTVNAKFEQPLWGRIRWQMEFLPLMDLIVIITFWLSEILETYDKEMRREVEVGRGSHPVRVLITDHPTTACHQTHDY